MIGAVILSTLQMRALRLREVSSLLVGGRAQVWVYTPQARI